jgi:CubicO group peptidase (beta-lactamase class C family)
MKPIICALVFTALITGQPLPISAPEQVGLSSERLNRIHKLLDQMVADGKRAGAITLIARNGKIVDWKTYGYRDLARRLPMEKDTICRIWSMTKIVTSVAAMMLIEEGKMSLSDPVEKYIPELQGLKVLKGGTADQPELEDAVRRVTVKHLLTHTSGLTYGFGDPVMAQLYNGKKVFDNSSLKSFIGKVATLPLAAQPGEKFNYGISTDVLGYLIEVVSGMPFDQFVQNRILAPLRMNDTHFQVPKEKVTRLAKTYTIREGRLVENPPNDSMGEINPEVPYGGMSLYSTIGDYARFGQMLLNGGQLDGVRLLGRKTVELMTVNHLNNLAVPYSDKNGAYGFGLGGTVRVDVAKGNAPGSLGQFGWDGSATTYFRMDPNERAISLLFLQHEPLDRPTLELFSTLFYQAIVD